MTSLLRTALRAWYARRLQQLRSEPHPRGVAVIRSGDRRADRILLIGNGFAHGWGVDSHRQALSGRLADAIGDRTGRGCDVEYVGAEVMSARAARGWLGDRDLTAYDGVVIAIGASDALRRTPVPEWERGLGDLLSAVMAGLRSDAAALVVGIPPLRALEAFRGGVARSADRHRERLNAATAWLSELHGVAHLDIDEFTADARGRLAPAAVYAQLGSRLAAEVAPALVASRPEPTVREPHPEAPWEWSGAEEVVALAAADGVPELRRLTDAARAACAVDLAFVSLANGDRVHFVEGTNLLPGDIPRDLSFCHHTIEAGGTVVVRDARRDARFVGNPILELSPLRFYAGHPLRASDGRVIGTFGLLSRRTRVADAVPDEALREFAALAEVELRRFEKSAPPVAAAHVVPPKGARGSSATTRPVPLA